MADRKTRRRNRFLLLLACALALAGAVAAGRLALEWRRDESAAQALARGMQAYEQGEFARALPDLRRAAGRIRGNPDLYYAVADARRRVPETNARHVAPAIAFARLAREARPDDVRPRLLLLELYRTAGFVTELIDEAEALLARDPTNRVAHRARISAHLALGRHEDALVATEAARDAHPSEIEFLQAHIDALRIAGRSVAELQAEVRRRAPAYSDEPRYLALAGQLALLAGDVPGAAGCARQALGMDLRGPEALAEILRLVDRLIAEDPALFEQASDVVDAAMADPARAPALAALVLARDWRLMQVARARAHADALDPDHADLSDDALGWAALLASAPQGALIERSLRARPPTPTRQTWVAAIEANAALQARDLTLAREALDRAAPVVATEGPGACPPVALAEARLLLASGDAPAARDALQRLGFEQDWLVARAELLGVLLAQGSIAEAFAVLQADPLLSRLTALPRALATSTASLIVARQVGLEVATEAMAFVDQLAQDSPDDLDIRACRVAIMIALGREADAQAILNSINQESLSDDPRVLLAAAAGPGRVDPHVVARLLAAPPQDPEALLRAALVVAAATDIATGRALLERAAALCASDEESQAIRIARATFLDRVADPSAADELAALARDNPESIGAQTALLDSAAGWTRADDVHVAIARLRALTGQDKAAWRVHEARRLLTFEDSEASAAAAISLLVEAKRTSWPNPTISDLLASAHLRDPSEPAARQRAIRILVEGVQASAEGAVLYPRLVLLLRAAGDAPEAERQLNALLARENIPADLRLARAELATLAGRYEQARDDFRFLAAQGDERARLGEANALVGLGDWATAEAIFVQLVEQTSPAPAAILDYAEALAIYGHLERGLDVLGALPERVGDTPRALLIADYHMRHAPPGDGQSELRALAEGHDAEAGARAANILARHLVQRGRPSDAVSVAEEFLARYPDDAGLREVRALARLTLGVDPESETDSIEELARLAREREPDSTFAMLTDAMLQRARHQIDAAAYVDRLEALVIREPTFLPTRAALVETLLGQGRTSDAADAAARASDAVPESAEAAAFAARINAQAAQYTQSQLYVARWKALLRTPAVEPDMLASAIALAQGQPHAARAALSEWIDPLISRARQSKADRPLVAAVLALDSRLQTAHSLFPGQMLGPEDMPDYIATAHHVLPSSVDLASTWLRDAGPRLDRTSDRVLIAAALLEIGDSRRHAPSLRAALQLLETLDPDDPDAGAATSMIASARALLDDTAEAIAAYRRALARNPEDLVALNNVAMLLARSPETAHEAVAHARAALALAERLQVPPDAMANILDTCGVAMIAAGDPPAALTSFRRGLELSPGIPGCQVGVVEALLAQRELHAARAALARVGAADADAETAARLARVRAALQ